MPWTEKNKNNKHLIKHGQLEHLFSLVQLDTFISTVGKNGITLGRKEVLSFQKLILSRIRIIRVYFCSQLVLRVSFSFGLTCQVFYTQAS